jgi:hypothetical protein
MQVKPDRLRWCSWRNAVRDGRFSIPIGLSFPLKDANAAHTAAEGGHRGKILLLA